MDDKTGLVLDGYRLIRPLGRGGFGEVWLCRSQAMGDFRAIKLISTDDPAKVAKEHSAMLRYRTVSGFDSRHLVPIEHINLDGRALYYVMPLADGTGGDGPESPSWKPRTLAALIEARRGEGAWFSSGEIIGLISPVLLALQTLLDAKLVHGDVKPANILFFNGAPRLADLGLLDDDRLSRTRTGTPVFSAPSWYGGGLPDMYSVAATLYVLLTGNDPDTMGRSAFRWPPSGEASLSPSERAEWVRLHRVVHRAADERVAERYPDFAAMLDAVGGSSPAGASPSSSPSWRKKGILAVAAVAVLALALAGAAAMLSGTISAGRGDGNRPALPTKTQTGDLPGETDPQEDYILAYQALLAVYADGVPLDQHRTVMQFANGMVYPHDDRGRGLDPLAAVERLDILMESIPKLKDVPRVGLARLLLLELAGESEQVAEGMRDPFLAAPLAGDRTPAIQAKLLCRLGAPDKAEALLTELISSGNFPKGQKPRMMVERARSRLFQDRFDQAHEDVRELLSWLESDPAKEAEIRSAIADLKKEFPAYAEYSRKKEEK